MKITNADIPSVIGPATGIYKDNVNILKLLSGQARYLNVCRVALNAARAGTVVTTYNNGIMAKDPETAAMNFLRALEKLPGFIKQEQEKISEIQKDLPILQEVVNGTWARESRLSELKTELAAVERKIQLSITPETKADTPEQVEKQKETPMVQESIVRAKGIHIPRGIL
jgi:hypothetical protein